MEESLSFAFGFLEDRGRLLQCLERIHLAKDNEISC